MHHQLFEGGGKTFGAIVPDVVEQGLAANRAGIRLVPHPPQVNPVIVVGKKQHRLAVCDVAEEHPLVPRDEVTEFFRQRRLDVRLIRNDLLLDKEIDELIQPLVRHLIERGGIGGRLKRGQFTVVVFFEAQG